MDLYLRLHDEVTKPVDINSKNIRKLALDDKLDANVYENEYYVVNIVAVSDKNTYVNFSYDVDHLANNLNKNSLPKDVKIVTFLNSEITNYEGSSKKIDIELLPNQPKSLYIGIDCSYLATSSIVRLNIGDYIFNVNIAKCGHFLHNKGADRENTLSRLEWLNSKLFLNNKSSYIYDDIKVVDDTLYFNGKSVKLGKDGYIKQVTSYIDDTLKLSDSPVAEMLDGGIRLHVADNMIYDEYKLEQNGANYILSNTAHNDDIDMNITANIHYQGVINYNVKVTAKRDTIIDIEEKNFFAKYSSKYMSGLGMESTLFRPFNYKWSNYDSIYVGCVNAGAIIKWNSEGENIWNNGGEGGIDVLIEKERAKVVAYSNKIQLKEGDSKNISYTIYLTPFHPLQYSNFGVRNYHNNKLTYMTDKKMYLKADRHNLNNIIIDKNKAVYPYLNYPFKQNNSIKELAIECVEHKVGTNIHYNLKDISSNACENVAFNELEDQIFAKTSNNIKNKTNENIIVTQKVNYTQGDLKGVLDYGLKIKDKSRYNNFYVEGVNWLVKECEVKGIKLEDNVLDSITIERVRKALDRYNATIDLDINSGKKSNELLKYADILPFVDSMLINPSTNIKNMSPISILLDVSGLNMGIKNDMVEGDPFLGLLFGMISRSGYNQRKPSKVYKMLEKFDIKNSTMYGFWSEKALVSKDPGVKVTYYVKDKKALICMFNFNNYPAVTTIDYSPLKIKGTMKSYPMSKLIMHQKFNEKSPVVLYNKCGVFMLADLD